MAGRAVLEGFGAAGGPAFPIPRARMVHGAAVIESICRPGDSGQPQKAA